MANHPHLYFGHCLKVKLPQTYVQVGWSCNDCGSVFYLLPPNRPRPLKNIPRCLNCDAQLTAQLIERNEFDLGAVFLDLFGDEDRFSVIYLPGDPLADVYILPNKPDDQVGQHLDFPGSHPLTQAHTRLDGDWQTLIDWLAQKGVVAEPHYRIIAYYL